MSDVLDPPAGLDHNHATQPGVLIRRLHQIHVALFAEECAGFDITPVQYSLMTAIALKPGLDQLALSDATGLDRPTGASVVARLEEAGLLNRTTNLLDKRQILIALSPRGKSLLTKMQDPVTRAHTRTIAALPEPDRALFMELLKKLVDAGNRHGSEKIRLK